MIKQPDPVTLDVAGGVPANATKTETTSANLQFWLKSPLLEVGCGDAPIDSAPKNVDVLSLTGCKTQAYTTWNTVGRQLALAYRRTNNAATTASASIESDGELIVDHTHPAVVALGKTSARKVFDGRYGYNTITKSLQPLTKHAKVRRSIDDDLASSADRPDTDTAPVQRGEVGRGPNLNPANPSTKIGLGSAPTPTNPASGSAYHFGNNPDSYFGVLDIPARIVTTTSYRTHNEPEPTHSPYSNQLYERLVEPHATGALASMVRAPNVRDAASLVSLSKYVRTINTTSKEVATPTRALCMIHALDKAVHQADPNKFLAVRNFTHVRTFGPDITTNPAFQRLNGGRICAVPLDLAIQMTINKLEPVVIPNFEYSGLDDTWAMVPIRQTALNNSSALAFAICHATTEYYAGMINYYSAGTLSQPDGQQPIPVTVTTMPGASSVHIPGVKHIMLVLLDCSTASAPQNIRLGDGNVIVPVMTAHGPNEPADLSQLWYGYFTNANLARIQRDFQGAYLEIANNFSTQTTIGEALSLAAELSHVQPTGITPQLNADGTVNTLAAMHGVWTIGAQNVGTNNFPVHSHPLPVDDVQECENILRGYCFRMLSPLHRYATGRVAALFESKVIDNLQVRNAVWGTRTPTIAVNGYRTATLTSAMRLAIATNLIEIGHQMYRFTSPSGIAGWLTMNAAAIAFSTSVYLTQQPFTLRDWSGTGREEDDTTLVQIVNKHIQEATNDMAIPASLPGLCSLLPGGAWDLIYEYNLLDLPENENVGLFSPYPLISFLQWRAKLNLSSGASIPPERAVRVSANGIAYGVELEPGTKDKVVDLAATPDCGTYMPRMLIRRPGRNWVPIAPSIENWAFYGNAGLHNVIKNSLYASLVPTVGNFNIAGSIGEPMRVLITDSRTAMKSESAQLRTMDIRYPDPPSTFLQMLNDYLAQPAISGLAGYLSGGPVGAAAATGLAIAKAAITDATKAPELKRQPEPTVQRPNTPPPSPAHQPKTAPTTVIVKPADGEEKASTKAVLEQN